MKRSLMSGLMSAVCLTFLPPLAGAQPPASPPPMKMTTYQLVVLKPGPKAAEIGGSPEGQTIVKAHVDHLYKAAADGINMIAGPFLDGGEIAGIIVMKAPSIERALELEGADPGVKAGLFTMEASSFMAPENWFGKWAAFPNFEKVFFGFLVTGPNRGQDAETAKRLQAEHLAYMDGQAKEGKLVMAGPFTGDGARRGIVVYRVADDAEARRRGEGDPMIKAGRLALELHAWQVPQGALPK